MPNIQVVTGANATLQFVPNTSVRGGQLAQDIVKTEYSIDTAVGRITGVQVCVQTELKTFHELGRRQGSSLEPGNVNIRGQIKRAYINGALLRLLMGNAAQPNQEGEIADIEVQPNFSLVIDLKDNLSQAGSGGTKIIVNGVRFENWSVSVPEDDFVMEDVTFQALRIAREEREETT